MLNDIKKFFEERLTPQPGNPRTEKSSIEYATAALMIELAKADFAEDDLERQLILVMLRDTFDLDDDALEQIVSLAESETADANDLFQFTRLINEHYPQEDKIELLNNLWRVAYADGRIDKYEEQFIRRVAGLIHLPPSQFTKAKIRIREELEGNED